MQSRVISEQLKLMWSNEVPMVRRNCIISPWSEWQLISIAEIRARRAVAAVLHRSIRCEQYPSTPSWVSHAGSHRAPQEQRPGEGFLPFIASLLPCIPLSSDLYFQFPDCTFNLICSPYPIAHTFPSLAHLCIIACFATRLYAEAFPTERGSENTDTSPIYSGQSPAWASAQSFEPTSDIWLVRD